MCSPCLCTFQPVPPSIHPSLHLVDFFFRNLFKISCFCSFLLRATTHTLAVDASSAHVHRGEWCLTLLIHFAARSKSAEVMSQLCSTASSKCIPQENSLATGGCFKRNTYRVTALGWLKKEEEDEQFLQCSFNRFRFATLKQLLHIAITTADWGRLY